MGDFGEFLSKHDGLPPLWPCSPRWPDDEALLDQLIAEMPGGAPPKMIRWVLGNAKQQRQMDARWRHFV